MSKLLSTYEQIPQIVAQAMLDTLSMMFGQEMSYHKDSSLAVPDKLVMTRVKMSHGGTEIDFWFRFDMKLLISAAERVFTPEYLKMTPMHEDLACEIANIVCHKVKDYLVDAGYYADMGFPFVVGPNELPKTAAEFQPHMYFHYTAGAAEGLGVTINMTYK
jgi:hypothetical protein